MHIARAVLILQFAWLAACTGPRPDESAAPAAPEPARFTDEVPIEVVRYVAGDGPVHDDLPPGFPPVDLPDGLRPLVAQGGDRGQRVLFSAGADLVAARDALARAFLATEGWRELSAPLLGAPREVFPNPLRPIFSTVPVREVCHEEFGTLRIQPDDANAVLTLSRTLPQPTPGGWCARQDEMRERSGSLARDDGMTELLPRLEPPPGEIATLPLGGGSSGRRFGIELSGADQSLRRLASHFAGQMEEQGWSRDAQWRGRLGAGSTWVRPTSEPERRALGFLEIRESGEDTFEIVFRVRTIGCEEPFGTRVLGPAIGLDRGCTP